jgi:hypothetical protein
VSEPHSGIIGESSPNTLDMTSIYSAGNQKVCVEIATSDINSLKSSVYRVSRIMETPRDKRNTLDRWFLTESSIDKEKVVRYTGEHYQMPRRLDWNLFRRIYDIQPQNYEQLISIPGVGPAAVRALSLIGEIIFGTKASWQDPVKYNFAHGGKDGVPYPVTRETYDKSISYLSSGIEGAEIEREQKIQALRKLAGYSDRIFNQGKG